MSAHLHEGITYTEKKSSNFFFLSLHKQNIFFNIHALKNTLVLFTNKKIHLSLTQAR